MYRALLKFFFSLKVCHCRDVISPLLTSFCSRQSACPLNPPCHCCIVWVWNLWKVQISEGHVTDESAKGLTLYVFVQQFPNFLFWMSLFLGHCLFQFLESWQDQTNPYTPCMYQVLYILSKYQLGTQYVSGEYPVKTRNIPISGTNQANTP